MAKHKKQHYIPKSYLKAWCDPSTPKKYTPYIWIFQKSTKDAKKKAPDNIFYEIDLYTIWDDEKNRNLVIEHSLSELEKEFSQIRRKKLTLKKELTSQEHFTVCEFMAAMHSRTKVQIQHMSNSWKPVLELMDSMKEQMENSTEVEKIQLANSWKSLSPKDDENHGSYEDVEYMVEKPMESQMISMIQVETPLLAKLDFLILNTKDKQGFITSDSPCIWYDPEAYKRPPIYQSPALQYDSIEILFPISPTQCIFLNRKGLEGYMSIDNKVLNNTNRIIQHHADKYYVSNQDKINEFWFYKYPEPRDSWNNLHR